MIVKLAYYLAPSCPLIDWQLNDQGMRKLPIIELFLRKHTSALFQEQLQWLSPCRLAHAIRQ